MTDQRKISEKGAVPVAWREPFSTRAPYRDVRKHGESIAEIVASVPDLPLLFRERGIVCINGHEVPREVWARVRPKPNSIERPIAVTLHWRLQGGGGGQGGGGTKSIIALVGAIALTALTGGIASGAILGNLTGMVGTSLFGSAALGAQLLAGAVGVAGALAISALTAPPQASAQQQAATPEQKGPASATGNVLAPGGAIPRILGTRRAFPPLVGDPIIEIIDDDQYAEACFAFNGPHLLEDIRIGDAPLEEAEDVEFETREGWDDDTPVTLTARQGKQTPLSIEMSSHTVDPSNQINLKDSASPDSDIPVFHAFSSKNAPDEIWLHLSLPAGLCKQSDPSDDRSIPFRIRMRLRGTSTWINLPEVHLSGRTASLLRVAFKFLWATFPGVIPAVPTQSGFVYASINVPGQATAPATAGWAADSYFSDGSGSDYLQASAEATSKVTNTLLYDNRVEFYLAEGTFPKGIYDFEVKRGAAYDTSSFTGSTYAYNGTVQDFYTYAGTSPSTIPMSQLDLSDTVGLDLLQSIWNEHPIQATGLALIAIRALNRRVETLSVLASGYVKDWDGTGWADWTTTSNPAPHYADVLSGALNKDPLPDDIRDDTGLVAWRAKCITNGWTADIIVEDMRTEDVLTLLASCGYARPYQSEQYGVAVDDVHDDDDIVQVFSPRNIRSFRSEKSFARLPDGFIVTYRDADVNYEDAETIVYAEGYSGGDDGRFEAVTYDGLVDLAKVRTRAKFDLDQADQRSAFYYLDADIESIVCRKGDLVGVQHDTLDDRAGFALIKRLLTSGGDITGVVLDSEIPVTNEDDMHDVLDMHDVEDMHAVGVTTGIAIRHDDGTVSTHAISEASGDHDTLTLTTPIAIDASIVALEDSNQTYGALVVSGRLTAEYLRLLVAGIQPGKDGVFSLTLVDEAPDLDRDAATVLLLHCDGVDGATTFVDSSKSAHAVTVHGNAQIDTAQSVFGVGSGLFDGTGDSLSLADSPDWDFGQGNFTIDFWLRRNGDQADFAGVVSNIISSAPSSGIRLLFLPAPSSTNTLLLEMYAAGVMVLQIADATPIPDATWVHLAIVRFGSAAKLYRDGVAVASGTVADGDIDSNGDGLFIGRLYTDLSAFEFTGSIDEFRVSKGAARWLASFTPPTRAYS